MCFPIYPLKRSAIPESTKRTTNFQEGMRRLTRTSLEVDWSTKQKDLSDYSLMLKLSGYSSNYRKNTLAGILKRWDSVLTEINTGKRQFHRNREQIALQKLAKGGNNSSNWFLKGTVTTTLAVPITVNSELKSNIQKRLSSTKGPDGGSTMVLEQAGLKLPFTVPRPPSVTGCLHQDKCLVDDSKRCGGARIVYKAICNDCPETDGTRPQYIGTTGHSLHARSLAHHKDVKAKKLANSLAKHNSKFHPETSISAQRYKFHQMSAHPKNLERLLTEAYWIHNSSNIMNSKAEYGMGKWIGVDFSSQAT